MPPADVVLLHGFPETAAAWAAVVGPLEEAGHRVVAPDLHGADIVARALELAPGRFHLVGHDVGAQAAWRIADAHPDRVISLTAVAAPHPAAFERAVAGEGGSDQAARTFYLDHFRAPGAEDLFLADGGAGLRRLFAASNHTGDVDAHVEAMLAPGALTDALGWYRTDLPRPVGDVAVPTLYVWGTEDTVIGPEAARFTADHVTGPYRFETLDGAGHWIPELDADRFVPLVLAHLEANPG